MLEFIFNSCKNKPVELKKSGKKMQIDSIAKTDVRSYTFIVSAKDWQTVNNTDRFVDINVPTITKTILNKGCVTIYLIQEDKYLALPFNYYQIRKIISFQPSYEPGHAYINIYGNFVLNVNTHYKFKLLVVSPQELLKNKNLDWQNYCAVKKALAIEDER